MAAATMRMMMMMMKMMKKKNNRILFTLRYGRPWGTQKTKAKVNSKRGQIKEQLRLEEK